jgi:hypothetical protein
MSMRASFRVVLTAIAGSLISESVPALEKRPIQFDGSLPDEWSTRNSCRVHYYNICTGWIWCWSGFQDGDRIGQVFDSCLPPDSNSLLDTIHFVCTSAPAAYGFTGTISVFPVDANNCLVGGPIASQPFLPHFDVYPFQFVNWAGTAVSNRFAVVIEIRDEQGLANPAQFGTDRPAAGPTGPNACGTCYPIDRPNHSYSYGNASSPLCPGIPFNDGVCDAQLFWDADLFGETPLATPDTPLKSWGAIKGLYR